MNPERDSKNMLHEYILKNKMVVYYIGLIMT